jgi:diguanylate cyclase (GGDEF)-like protein
VGDHVLREAALRMTATLRTGDTLGRWGGDEFLVVVERLADPQEAVDLAERIQASLLAPIDIDPSGNGSAIAVNVSAGVAHLNDGQSAESLIETADRTLQANRGARRR